MSDIIVIGPCIAGPNKVALDQNEIISRARAIAVYGQVSTFNAVNVPAGPGMKKKPDYKFQRESERVQNKLGNLYVNPSCGFIN